MKKDWRKLDIMKDKKIINKHTNTPMKCAMCGKVGLLNFHGIPTPDRGIVKLCDDCFQYIARRADANRTFQHNNR